MPKAPLKLTLGWLIIVVIVYALLFNWLDIPLMYFISHDYQGTFLFTLSKGLKIIFLPQLWFGIGVLCFVYVWWAQNHAQLKFKKYALSFGINLIFAFILAFIVKFCFARYRPVDLLNSNLYGFHYFSLLNGSGSTPSGHTVMSFTLFLTLARFFNKTWVTLVCLMPPIIIAISRLILADHYISDVMLGAYLGVISVFWGEWIRARFFASWSQTGVHVTTR
jgi:membrane-associated phospholipid phosphatase